MERNTHLSIQCDESGRVANQCPYKKEHKNGAKIYIDGLSCRQCVYYNGIDDDGKVACGFTFQNTNKKNKKEDSYLQNKEKT